MPKDFWAHFQVHLRENRLPEFIVQVLKKTGYDSPFSIQLLDEQKIKGIEETVNKRLNNIKSIFKGTEYEDIETFELLPGHTTLLLGLGVFVKQYLQETKVKKTKKISNLPTIIEEGDETVEIFTEEERNTIKKVLIEKVNKFLKKFRISGDHVSENSIIGSLDAIINNKGALIYKCSFCCGVNSCKVKIPCVFNKHWQISNLERHIKLTHVEARKPNAETVDELNKILASGSSISNSTSSRQNLTESDSNSLSDSTTKNT